MEWITLIACFLGGEDSNKNYLWPFFLKRWTLDIQEIRICPTWGPFTCSSRASTLLFTLTTVRVFLFCHTLSLFYGHFEGGVFKKKNQHHTWKIWWGHLNHFIFLWTDLWDLCEGEKAVNICGINSDELFNM